VQRVVSVSLERHHARRLSRKSSTARRSLRDEPFSQRRTPRYGIIVIIFYGRRRRYFRRFKPGLFQRGARGHQLKSRRILRDKLVTSLWRANVLRVASRWSALDASPNGPIARVCYPVTFTRCVRGYLHYPPGGVFLGEVVVSRLVFSFSISRLVFPVLLHA